MQGSTMLRYGMEYIFISLPSQQLLCLSRRLPIPKPSRLLIIGRHESDPLVHPSSNPQLIYTTPTSPTPHLIILSSSPPFPPHRPHHHSTSPLPPLSPLSPPSPPHRPHLTTLPPLPPSLHFTPLSLPPKSLTTLSISPPSFSSPPSPLSPTSPPHQSPTLSP